MHVQPRETARSLNKGRESVRKIFRDELKCKAYKKRKVHGISEASEKKRLERSSALLAWHGGDEIIFSDEKLFVLEQTFNVQNDRLWSVDIQSIPSEKKNVPRFQNASAVMVWAAISKRGKFPLIFIERGVKINANYYLEEILKRMCCLMPQKCTEMNIIVFSRTEPLLTPQMWYKRGAKKI